MIVDILNRYQGMIKTALLFTGPQLDYLQWPQGRQNSEAEWSSSGDGVVVKKTPTQPVFLDNHHLFLRYCLLYQLPNFLICQNMGALHLLPPDQMGEEEAFHRPHILQLLGQRVEMKVDLKTDLADQVLCGCVAVHCHLIIQPVCSDDAASTGNIWQGKQKGEHFIVQYCVLGLFC